MAHLCHRFTVGCFVATAQMITQAQPEFNDLGHGPAPSGFHESPNQELRTGIVLRMLRPCSGETSRFSRVQGQSSASLPSLWPQACLGLQPCPWALPSSSTFGSRDANSQLRCSFRSSELRNRAKHPSLRRVKPSKLPRLITFPPPIPRLRPQLRPSVSEAPPPTWPPSAPMALPYLEAVLCEFPPPRNR